MSPRSGKNLGFYGAREGPSSGHIVLSWPQAVSEAAPYPLIVHYIGCQPFCSAVRILSERLHSLRSFTTFYPQCILISSVQPMYNRCTLAEALFPTINAENRRAGRESWRVWMRDDFYIFFISALTFISYIISKIYTTLAITQFNISFVYRGGIVVNFQKDDNSVDN